MSSLSIKNATGASANISTTTLSDGTTAVNHVAIDTTGAVIVPASKADVQAIATAIAAQTAQLIGQSLILTDAFGAVPTDVFGNAI